MPPITRHWHRPTRRLLSAVCVLAWAACMQAAQAQERPNILWIVSEDNSAGWLGCYGNKQATTPHLDRLAATGFRYTRTFADAPVCAPQRSSWILGMPALTAGTHPMRSANAIPERLRYYSDHLREAGYWTHNARKCDYNVGGRNERAAWDSMAEHWGSHGAEGTPWRQAPESQPFFCIVNIDSSHERFAFEKIDQTRNWGTCINRLGTPADCRPES